MGASSITVGRGEIVGPPVRLAKGSSSRRKSGGGESAGEVTLGSGEAAGMLLRTPVQRPSTAAEVWARLLDILLLVGDVVVGEVGGVLLEDELEDPWRKDGTRIAWTERRRFFIFGFTDLARRGSGHASFRYRSV